MWHNNIASILLAFGFNAGYSSVLDLAFEMIIPTSMAKLMATNQTKSVIFFEDIVAYKTIPFVVLCK